MELIFEDPDSKFAELNFSDIRKLSNVNLLEHTHKRKKYIMMKSIHIE